MFSKSAILFGAARGADPRVGSGSVPTPRTETAQGAVFADLSPWPTFKLSQGVMSLTGWPPGSIGRSLSRCSRTKRQHSYAIPSEHNRTKS